MNKQNSVRRIGLLSLALLTLVGCAELGYLGDFGSSRGLFRGTVQRNDPRYSSILMDNETGDRRQVAFYHNPDTRTRYRGSEYPVQSVQPGDYIEVRTRDPEKENPTAVSIVVLKKR